MQSLFPPPPPTYTLRPYQSAAVEAFWSFLVHQSGNPVIVLPTGAGKSLVIAQVCRDAVQRFKGRVIVLAHRKELLQQNAAKIRALVPDVDIGIYSAGLNKRDTEHDILVAGIQSIYRKAYDLGQRHLVLLDECFTGETLIETPRGQIPISRIVPGDRVYNAIGVGTVISTRCTFTRHIYQVEFANGRYVRCTGNHRFCTTEGAWVRADCLETGQSIVDIETVSTMWGRVPPESIREEIDVTQIMDCGQVLHNSLCQAAFKSSGNRGRKEEVKRWTQGQGDHVFCSRRKWQFIAEERANAGHIAGAGLGVRSCCANKDTEGERIPHMLQDRYSESEDHGWDRGRRTVSLDVWPQSGRCQEGFVVADVRLEDYSHCKSGCGTPVYDLQVSGHPSFFAGGVLVHNCHLVPHDGEGMYRHFLQELRSANEKVRLGGLTATPFRLDCGPLCRPDGLFQRVCYSAPIRELIDAGYLSPLTTTPSTTKVDTSGLHLRGGEFIAGEAEGVFDRATDQACREIVDLTRDRQSVLVFCTGVQHAAHVAVTIEKLAGQRCGLVTGETMPLERSATLADFGGRHLRYLVNVDVLTTGFDAPCIDCIAILRATMSAGLYAQICGRGFRKSPGKTDCLVLDFGGNIARHGPLDAINYGRCERTGAKTGEAPTKTCPNCEAELLIQTRECPECGFSFPVERKPHDAEADTDTPILSEPEEWTVEEVTYSAHRKKNAAPDDPSTLRVDYACIPIDGGGNLDRKIISEWVCIEHVGWARKKAERWWSARSMVECPATAEEAAEWGTRGALAWPRKITTIKEGRWYRVTKTDLEEKPSEWLEPIEASGFDSEEIPF